ncbi:hypothetical protein ABBQ38_009324 [Trebouxia sp. C0009 RCD-2024]
MAGLHCKPPGVARAALLARSRIPRNGKDADLPRQLWQPQQDQQQLQQQQLSMPAGNVSHTGSSCGTPLPQGPHQYLSPPRLPIPPGSIEAYQTTLAAAQAASVAAGSKSMQLAGDHQYLQPGRPQLVSHHHHQQSLGPLPSATKAQAWPQYGYLQPQLGRNHHQHLWQQQQMPVHRLGRQQQLQQQQQVPLDQLDRQLQHQQPVPQQLCHGWQHGESMPAARAVTPWVQHAWYAALPGGHQPPGARPCNPHDCTQHERPQPHLDPPASRAPHPVSHVAMSQYGMPYEGCMNWTGHNGHGAPDASEAAEVDIDYSMTCNPSLLNSQLQQQQQNSKQELPSETSPLSPSTKVPKGVIKTYNLKALLS